METEKYNTAIGTHKFYDTVSNSIVVGQLSISGAAFYLYKEIKGTSIDYFPFVGAALCIAVLLMIYRDCAHYANVARNVAADLEEGKITYGVSVAFKTNSHPAKKCWRRGIYGKIHLLTAVLIIGLLVSAMKAVGYV